MARRERDAVRRSSKRSPPPGLSPMAIAQWAFYRSVRFLACFAGIYFFDLRCHGRHHGKFPGGALILSTHQSHLDPLLIGVTFQERLNYLAKRSLFKGRLLGLVITLLNAIELDRDRSGLAGLKETLKRLRDGKKVLIFPEGTRSADGRIAPLKPGFISVARRGAVPLIPVAIVGAFEAMPRGRLLPRLLPIHVTVGRPISADEVRELDDEHLLRLVAERLDACYSHAARL